MVCVDEHEIIDKLPWKVIDDLAYLSHEIARPSNKAIEDRLMTKLDGYLWSLQSTEFLQPYEESFLIEWLTETDRSKEIGNWYTDEYSWLIEEDENDDTEN